MGNHGEGSLRIEQGATATLQSTAIGVRSGGDGTLTVTDHGSLLTATSMHVGYEQAAGHVEVLDRGIVDVPGPLFIGELAGSTGTVNVDGLGSSFTAGGGVAVGSEGTGTLTISDRGVLTSGVVVYVGQEVGGVGTLNINGTESGAGVLDTTTVAEGNGSGSVNFDGGEFLAQTDGVYLFQGFEPGDVTILSGGALVHTNGYEVDIPVTIDGVGRLTKIGAGQLVLSAANTFQGGAAVQEGALLANVGGAFPDATPYRVDGGSLELGGFDLTMTELTGAGGKIELGGAGLTVDNSSDCTYGGSIRGAGTLTKGLPGTLTLSGSNSYTGGTWIEAGVLSVSSDENLGNASGTLTFDGGTLRTPSSFTMTRNSVISSSGGTIDVPSGQQLTHAGGLSGVGVLHHNGAGTLVINTSSNTMTGGIEVNAGAVVAGQASAFPNVAYTVNAGSLQANNFPFTASSLAGTGGSVVIGSGMLTVNQSANTSYAGAISGTGALRKHGDGTLALSGVNTHSGGTQMNGGTLSVGGDSSLGAAGGGLSFDGGALRTTATFNMSRPTAINGGGGTFDVTGTLGQFGALSGSGALNKIGSGHLALPLSNHTYNGIITVNQGELSLGTSSMQVVGVHVGDSGTDGSSTLTIRDGSTFTANTFFTVGDNLTGIGAGGIGTLNVESSGVLTMGAGAKLTLGWVQAEGTLNLNAGGTVQVNGTDGIQRHTTGVSHFNLNGGTLQVTSSNFSTSVDVTLTGSPSTVDTNGFQATLSGSISGAGELNKSGTGTLVLTNANTYTGGTTVFGGVLVGSNPGALPSNTAYAVNGGTLVLNNHALTTSSLSGSGGAVSLGAAFLTVQQNVDTSYAGAIDGSGGLVKLGTGTFSLAGANTYTGGTVVDEGELKVLGSIAGPTSVGPGGMLSGTGTVHGSVQLQGLLLPGASVGMLTCTGGVVSDFGVVQLEITGPGAGTGHDQLRIVGGTLDLGDQATYLEFTQLSGTFLSTDKLFIVEASSGGNTAGTFLGLPDNGDAGTAVAALAGLGGFDEWRIFYRADSSTNSLTGGNDIALAPYACTGEERVKKASCRDRGGENQVKIILAGGRPGDTFTVTLSSDGAEKSGTINARGKGKAKFNNRPAGDSGVATAEWGCGAGDEKEYACP